MKEIDDKEAAELVSIIYKLNLDKRYENFKGKDKKITVKQLVEIIERDLKYEPGSMKFGGEMTKQEYYDVIDQIKSSETLMSMEVVDFKHDENTNFRAMTLADPNNNIKPVVVFRGTAGNYQWDDNVAGVFSSHTPSQMEAQKYVIQSGYDHLTVVGHSKGGNMAATMAYLLPEGMVDKVYSIDGQGVSDIFLANIPEDKVQSAKDKIHNINEYRDVVSQILNKTGSDKNTIYFDSGIDFKDTGLSGFKMYFFHTHKPNYYLSENMEYMNRTFVPARIGGLSLLINPDTMEKDKLLKTAQNVIGMLYGDEPLETRWSLELWDAVYEAEKVYDRVNKSRQDAILKKLSEMYGLDFNENNLIQEPTSFVVEGALLTCPYCSGFGSLENIENHGNVIQGKNIASKKDNKTGENIDMVNLLCSVIDFKQQGTDVTEHVCEPDICHEWIITDADKTVTVDGAEVEAVLKKSALGCLTGGVIEVLHNGQLNSGQIVVDKTIPVSEAGGEKETTVFEKTVKTIINYRKTLNDFDKDICETAWNAICGSADAAWNGIQDGVTDIINAPKNFQDNVMNQIEAVKEKWIEDIINSNVNFH